jgi:hypothetical protein
MAGLTALRGGNPGNKLNLFLDLEAGWPGEASHYTESPILIPSKVSGPRRRHEIFQRVGAAASLPQSHRDVAELPSK